MSDITILGETMQASTALLPGMAGGGASAEPVEAMGAAEAGDTPEATHTLLINLQLDEPLPGLHGTELQLMVPLVNVTEAPATEPIDDDYLALALALHDETDDE